MTTDRKVPGPGDDKQGWMMFAHSGPLDLCNLRPEDIHLGDIVHALGGINRFIGQTREPITVLWHSVIVAELCRFDHFNIQLEALLHDAAEAYVGDWISPLYGLVDERTQGLKEHIQETVYAAAGLDGQSAVLTRPVNDADKLMARYESESEHGYGRVVPWHIPITGVERERVHAAIKGIGSPSDRRPERDFIRWRFLHKCEELLPSNAPLARTLDAAKEVYRRRQPA